MTFEEIIAKLPKPYYKDDDYYGLTISIIHVTLSIRG